MTWTWWLLLVITPGLGLVFAPVIGAAWAARQMPMPEDRPNETIRSLRALYRHYIRGRREP